MNRIRVLQIVKKNLESNGICTFVENYAEVMPQYGIVFDVLCPGEILVEQKAKKLQDMGSTIWEFGLPLEGVNGKFVYYKKLHNFLKKHPYDIVQVNTGTPSILAAACMATIHTKTKIVIPHSHGCIKVNNCMKKIKNWLDRKLISICATTYFACSDEAAKCAFLPDGKEVTIIHNALPLRRFAFDQVVRTEIRKRLNVVDNFVVGCVGSLIEVKNHTFLLESFYELREMEQQAILLIVGTGKLEKELKEKAHFLGIEKSVLFYGECTDMASLYNAMDLFVMPSLSEGLPFSCIEAQINGLPCLLSEGISSEAKILDSTIMENLEKGTGYWAERMFKMSNWERDADSLKKMKIAGYDINLQAERLNQIYMKWLFKSEVHKI